MSSGFKVGDMLEDKNDHNRVIVIVSEFHIGGEKFFVILDEGKDSSNSDSYVVVKDSDWGTK